MHDTNISSQTATFFFLQILTVNKYSAQGKQCKPKHGNRLQWMGTGAVPDLHGRP